MQEQVTHEYSFASNIQLIIKGKIRMFLSEFLTA